LYTVCHLCLRSHFFIRSASVVEAFAIPLPDGLDTVAKEATEKRVILIGEESHGTQEFYAARSELTRALVMSTLATTSTPNTVFVVVEGSACRVEPLNEYCAGRLADLPPPHDVFPAWLWRNKVMDELYRWIREWNSKKNNVHVELIGMDLYEDSTSQMILQRHIPTHYNTGNGNADAVEAVFNANVYDQTMLYIHATVIQDAIAYRASNNSWNVRDMHMWNVLEYLLQRNETSKVIVMAHNSHVLDYRATSHNERGELSVGQVRNKRSLN
jgi:erythromycin esterase-like protein